MTSWLDFERPVVELEEKIQELKAQAGPKGAVQSELEELERQAEALRRQIFATLTPYQRVQLARHPRRPYALDYVERCFTDWTELHGDRHFADRVTQSAGEANGARVRRWFQEKKAGWYVVLADPQMPVTSTLLVVSL